MSKPMRTNKNMKSAGVVIIKSFTPLLLLSALLGNVDL